MDTCEQLTRNEGGSMNEAKTPIWAEPGKVVQQATVVMK